ncbi:MAG TPA: hypothetical protein DCE11_09120 [Ruminiclostridium sp.]|nr:hypothetical protein [Clostridiaceae bacterium]HAA26255.1 hypothetical protein [Ruminiclostridium sp.]
MGGYFVTPVENEALDVNAHNEQEQKLVKHPDKSLWAVKVLPGNKYIQARLTGKIVQSLSVDWNAEDT